MPFAKLELTLNKCFYLVEEIIPLIGTGLNRNPGISQFATSNIDQLSDLTRGNYIREKDLDLN